jgi:acetyl-CoA carboxylase carboxyltransferase component
MTWQPELDELKKRQQLALAMGGPEKVARHKANGKLTVRERIAALCDDCSFREIGSGSGFAAYDERSELQSFSPTNQSTGRFNIRYAWPSGEWGSLPIAGGLEAAYKAELEASTDPAAKLAEIEARLKQFTSPFRTAEQFLVEEIIDPRETRGLLCEFANLAAPLRTAGASAFDMRS